MERPATLKEIAAAVLEERAAWLYQKAGMYLGDGPWREDLIEVATIRARYWTQPGALWAAVQDPLVTDSVLFEGGAFAAFLGERGSLLPEDERLLAEQWLLTDRSVSEVESVQPGSGFVARDLRTGDLLDVLERAGSRFLKQGCCCAPGWSRQATPSSASAVSGSCPWASGTCCSRSSMPTPSRRISSRCFRRSSPHRRSNTATGDFRDHFYSSTPSLDDLH